MKRWSLQGKGGLSVASSRVFTLHSGAVIDGQEACFIDPGLLPGEIDAWRRLATSCNASVHSILLTHSHWDHVLGPEQMPQAHILAHRHFPVNPTDRRHGRIARQAHAWFAEQGVERAHAYTIPRPTGFLDDGAIHRVGCVPLRVLHAPGHAEDQIVVYFEGRQILWAADLLSDTEIPYVCHSLPAYEATLQRLSTLAVSVLVPAHGQVTDDCRETRRRLDADRGYLSELRRRIERAVREGRTVQEAVALCSDMNVACPDANRRAHRMNVEHVYCELGGEADASCLGWHRLHPETAFRGRPTLGIRNRQERRADADLDLDGSHSILFTRTSRLGSSLWPSLY